jgi:hypothetical protein
MSPTTPTVARVAGVGRREGDLTGAPGHGSCAWHELRSVSETGNERDYVGVRCLACTGVSTW